MESLGKGEALYFASETPILRHFHTRSNLFLSCANQDGSSQKKKKVGLELGGTQTNLYDSQGEGKGYNRAPHFFGHDYLYKQGIRNFGGKEWN
jgi:hypothetical protein